jgi:hypothetical protein
MCTVTIITGLLVPWFRSSRIVLYNTFSDNPERMEPVFPLFLTAADGDYRMATVHVNAGVVKMTFYYW